MLISNHLKKYKPAILSLPTDRLLTKEDLLTGDFLMERSEHLEMYYAPHNEYVNLSAKIAIIGITPGWTQMKIAFHEAREGLERGLPDEEICKRANEKAGFAGTMRRNLISMLNALDLHKYLNIASCEELFLQHRELLHSTALLRFPVFVDKKNYTGAHPRLLSTPFFQESARVLIQEEFALLKQSLIIPLGKTVENTLQVLQREGKFDSRRCLPGFPHPSGANGHRQRQFDSSLSRMKNTIQAIFSSLSG